MTAQAAQHNKTMFAIHKAAAISSAIVNTAAGVTQALAHYPPPLSFAMAGLQAAAGAVQIGAIAKQSFGGGAAGAPPSPSGAGGGSAASIATPNAGQSPGGGTGVGTQSSRPNVTLNIAGQPNDTITVQQFYDTFVHLHESGVEVPMPRWQER